MSIFISYSRKDEATVKALAQGLEAARQDIWFDADLTGGDIWWKSIVKNIRSSTVFLFAASNESLRSKPCLTELEYAAALNRPILPVQVGPLDNLRSTPFADRQIVPFRDSDSRTAFAVLASINEAMAQPWPLPEPLPAEPAIPYRYLKAIAEQIDGRELGLQQQLGVVEQLREALGDETDESVQHEIVSMLMKLDGKPYRAQKTGREIERVLRDYAPVTAVDEQLPGATKEESGAGPKELREEEPLSASSGPEFDSGTPGHPEPAAEPPSSPETPEPWDWEKQRVEPARPPTDETPSAAPWQEHATQAQASPPAGRPAAGGLPPAQSYFEDQAQQHRSHQESLARQYSAGQQQPSTPTFNSWHQGLLPASPQSFPTQSAPTQSFVPPPYSAQTGPPPSAHWPLSIIALLFSLIPGCVALYFSGQVGERLGRGDLEGAKRASKNAATWATVGIAIGVVLILFAVS